MKTVGTFQNGKRSVKVKFNRDYEEYVAELTVEGKRLPDADYFTNDKDDAIGTAKQMAGGDLCFA